MGPYSLDLRKRAIALYEETHNYSAVARQLQVSHAWVRNMILLFERTGSLDTHYESCGAPAKIGEQERVLLRDWLSQDSDLTLKDLQNLLREHGVEVSHTAVDNALKAMKITRKKNDRRNGARPPRCS